MMRPFLPGSRVAAWGFVVIVSAACAQSVNYGHAGPRFAALPTAEPPDRADQSVRVVTWNVKFGHRIDEAADVLRNDAALRDADVVLLQEVDEADAARLATGLGAGYVYYPATAHWKNGEHFGNAVVSRWPLVNDRKLVLPRTDWAHGTQRAAVVATALVAGRPIRVYSVHFATLFEVGAAGVEAQARAIIRDAEGSRDPVIVGGDLNVDYIGRLFHAEGWEWVTRDVGATRAVFALDHLFVRGFDEGPRRAGKVAADDFPSDHAAVWGAIGR